MSIKNVKGTSSTQDAVQLLCSKGVPCEGVEVGDIDIAYNGKEGPAKTSCENVKPTFVGKQNPPVCAGAQTAWALLIYIQLVEVVTNTYVRVDYWHHTGCGSFPN